MIAVKIDEPHAETVHNGSDIGLPWWKNMIAVLHEPSVLAIHASLAS
jgi:hypothetical protein